MAKTVKSLPNLDDVVNDTDRGDMQESVLSVTNGQIAERAYSLWEQGGCQEGTAELNWTRAEDELSNESA